METCDWKPPNPPLKLKGLWRRENTCHRTGTNRFNGDGKRAGAVSGSLDEVLALPLNRVTGLCDGDVRLEAAKTAANASKREETRANAVSGSMDDAIPRHGTAFFIGFLNERQRADRGIHRLLHSKTRDHEWRNHM